LKNEPDEIKLSHAVQMSKMRQKEFLETFRWQIKMQILPEDFRSSQKSVEHFQQDFEGNYL